MNYMLKLNPNYEANVKRAMEQIKRVQEKEREELAELIVQKLQAKASAYDGEAYG